MVSVGNKIFLDASDRRSNGVIPTDHVSSAMEKGTSGQNSPNTPILQNELREVLLVVNESVKVYAIWADEQVSVYYIFKSSQLNEPQLVVMALAVVVAIAEVIPLDYFPVKITISVTSTACVHVSVI